MNTVLCFSALIFLLTAFAIQVEQTTGDHDLSVNKPVAINWFALKGFQNYTGLTFGDAQLRSLINFINNASSFYPTNIQNNLNYIKANMDASFKGQYSVIMEIAPEKDIGYAVVYCQDGSNYAFIGQGVNQKFPNWTYFVYRMRFKEQESYKYISSDLARGYGINEDLGNRLSTVVQSIDGTRACECSQVVQISRSIERSVDGYWSIVCQSSSNIYSVAGIFNSTWIMLKPAACTYLIYSHMLSRS